MSTISASTTTTTAYKVTADTTGTLVLQTGATPTTAVTIDTSQNVGIGTSSPSYRLDVIGGGASATSWVASRNTSAAGAYGAGFLLQAGANVNNYSSIAHDTTGNLAINNAAGGYQAFLVGSSEKMRIDSSGNLLVGSTTTGGWTGISKLEAYNTGAAYAVSAFQNSSSTSACYLGRVDNANAYFARYYYGASTEVGKITTNGTSTTYATSSDYRLKENIAPLSGALETVSALKPCSYSWKSNGEVSQGFIAHELAEVIPDAVVGEKDAVDEDGNPVYQGIDTSFLVATLVAAIQELKAEIDQLKGQA